jgi:hypothetical protein
MTIHCGDLKPPRHNGTTRQVIDLLIWVSSVQIRGITGVGLNILLSSILTSSYKIYFVIFHYIQAFLFLHINYSITAFLKQFGAT